MKLITYGIPTGINYGSECAAFRHLFNNRHDEFLKLFSLHKTPGTGVCHLPVQWAPTVTDMMKKMLDVDPKLGFAKIYEKYGKLVVDVTPYSYQDEDVKIKLKDLIDTAQNRVDDITQGLVYRQLGGHKLDIKDNKWLLFRGIMYTTP